MRHIHSYIHTVSWQFFVLLLPVVLHALGNCVTFSLDYMLHFFICICLILWFVLHLLNLLPRDILCLYFFILCAAIAASFKRSYIHVHTGIDLSKLIPTFVWPLTMNVTVWLVKPDIFERYAEIESTDLWPSLILSVHLCPYTSVS